MTSVSDLSPPAIVAVTAAGESSRLDYLDATRAFALVLGIVFHASVSFAPAFIGWAVQDVSTSPVVDTFITVSHSFRMGTFFLLAGFFGQATLHRRGLGEFVRLRALRIVVPFVVGWFLLRPLIMSGWIMGAESRRGDYDFWAGVRGGFQSLHTLPAGIFTGTHLWFLYYLAMITGATLVLRGMMIWTGSRQGMTMQRADAFVAWLASSPFSLPALVVPTAAALWFMRSWGMDTPDRTLVPDLPVMIAYGGFFLLGWMFGRQRELISRFARLSLQRWIGACAGIAGVVFLSRIQDDPGHPHYMAAHVGFALSYATVMWTLVPLVIGVFKTFGERQFPVVRYVADASYWLYLVHLPIVVWLQVAVAAVPWHWSLKLAGVSATTIVVALLSYDLFVRSTFLGWTLNGRRRHRVLRWR